MMQVRDAKLCETLHTHQNLFGRRFALNDNLAIHSNDSFWIVQKDQASLSAVLPTTPRRPVQTGRLPHNDRRELLKMLKHLFRRKKISSPGREGKYLPAASEVPTAPDQPS